MSLNRNAADRKTFGEPTRALPPDPPRGGPRGSEGGDHWLTAAGATALVLGVGALSGDIAVYLVVVVAFGLGVAFAGSFFYITVYRPLRLAAGACQQILTGNLSHTVPEVGPPPLREMARVTNDMAADFQEILLLFAHLARSAQHSAQLLMTHAACGGISETDRRRAAEILEDVHEMQEMVREFKYFRVRFVDGRIIDCGIPSHSPQGNDGIPPHSPQGDDGIPRHFPQRDDIPAEVAAMSELQDAPAPPALAGLLATVSEGEKS